MGIFFLGSKKGSGTTFAFKFAYGDLISNSVSFFAYSIGIKAYPIFFFNLGEKHFDVT